MLSVRRDPTFVSINFQWSLTEAIEELADSSLNTLLVRRPLRGMGTTANLENVNNVPVRRAMVVAAILITIYLPPTARGAS